MPKIIVTRSKIVLPSHPKMRLDSVFKTLKALYTHGGLVTADKVAERGKVSRAMAGRCLGFLTELGLVRRTRSGLQGALHYELLEKGKPTAIALFQNDRVRALDEFAAAMIEVRTFQEILKFLKEREGHASLVALSTHLLNVSKEGWKPESLLPRVRAYVQMLDECELVTFDEKEEIIKIREPAQKITHPVKTTIDRFSIDSQQPDSLEADSSEPKIAEYTFGKIYLRIPHDRASIMHVRGILDLLEAELEEEQAK